MNAGLANFDVRIIQGNPSDSTVRNFLKSRISQPQGFGDKKINFNLVEEDISPNLEESGKSLALDTRTGEYFSYDANLNPARRKLTDLDIMVIFSGSRAQLVYSP